MKMCVPVEKIIIASNENNVLTRLINLGKYDLNGHGVVSTTSPAMDILKSSNVERILYDMFGFERTKELMNDLEVKNVYELTSEELSTLQNVFAADFCNGDEGKKYIKDTFNSGYLLDPHTATCLKAYESCAIEDYVTIAYSTAEWTKFSPTIANALTGELDARDEDALKSISEEAKLPIPAMIKDLFSKKIVQKTVIEKDKIEEEILKFL